MNPSLHRKVRKCAAEKLLALSLVPSTPNWQLSETGYWATQTQCNHAHILGLLPRADMQTELLLLFLCLLR